MKQYGFVYNSFEKMQSFIYSKNINNEENILIQVFTGVAEIGFIENIIHEILSILPQAEIIGATTGGEILRKRAFVGSTVISFTVFKETKIKSKLLNGNNNDYKLGSNIAEELVGEDTKVIILFSDGLVTNSYDIIKGIQLVNSNVAVCGGKAADNVALKKTFIFTKEGIRESGVAAVSLTGKQLNITTEYSFGWSTIGKLMTVTKASNNKIYTIDNIKTVEIYKKYLGNEIAKGLPISAAEFPLIVIKDGIEIANVPCACNDDGSLTFLSNIEVNDKVKFGYRNVNMLMDKSLEIYNRLAKSNVEVLFVYSCFIRKFFMQERTNLEIGPLNNIAPTFGFFTYGEFFTINNSNRLLNATMTILGISEGKHNSPSNKSMITKNENAVKNLFKREDIGTVKAFTNLVDEATKELQETNEMLEDEKHKIEKMNNITKLILQVNGKMISSSEFDGFIQLILDSLLNIISKGKIASVLLAENDRLCYKATKGYELDKIKDVTYSVENIYYFNENDSNELFNPRILKSINKLMVFKKYEYESWEKMISNQPRELLTCGIGIDGKAVGIINIFNTDKEEDFDEEDKSILKGVCYDIAIALKNFRLLNDMKYMSMHDSLTGIYNRRYFREMLHEISNKSKALKTSFIICWIDLNKFKIINDTYGHDKGDEVLKKFAEIFKMEIDEEDVFARIGGDEFVVVFVNKSEKRVIEVIDKTSTILRKCDFKLGEDVGDIKFAYGLSEFLIDSDDIEELLKIADKRMYERKKIMLN